MLKMLVLCLRLYERYNNIYTDLQVMDNLHFYKYFRSRKRFLTGKFILTQGFEVI